jgi:transposase
VQTVNRLHRLLTELIPGGANKRDLSALQAKRLLATVRPRTLVGKTMRRMAVEELADLGAVDTKLKAIKKGLRTAVSDRGSHLMELFGIGPAGAARILCDTGDVARFPDRNHFASWTGTAPLDASSGCAGHRKPVHPGRAGPGAGDRGTRRSAAAARRHPIPCYAPT